MVPTDSLAHGDSPRLMGEDMEHIRVLAQSEEPLPPILVHRQTMRVVDGTHRLRAARLRGQVAIEVEFFEGDESEAFVAAVQANITHGLPLSLTDREAAASRIITSHPHYSDRAIAMITGLAARTVAAIRARNGQESDREVARLGLDGRVRPLSSEHARLAAGELIAKYPEASLREVARAVGLSPATVRDVRERARRGDHPVPLQQRCGRSSDGPERRAHNRAASSPPVETRTPTMLVQNLSQDPSLRLSESGRALLRLLLDRATDPQECEKLIRTVPAHCGYGVAEVARAIARAWSTFADRLDQQLSDDG